MTTTAQTNTISWNIDSSHSEIGFKVRHMMISNVSGFFERYSLKVETESLDFTKSKIEFIADTSSINTDSEQRDAHLKGADFFDCENFPSLKFEATKVEHLKDENYLLYGNLTIKEISKEVKLELEFGGIGKDPWGNERAGFNFNGKINRSDWNLTWNAGLETGGVLVSDEVKLFGEIELVKA
ncbi:MAG: polyisoprenoid-binding protein [Bacteroidetes bacterium]|nr:polyisoprenoid-binding protein [Bacteroidota bacterium]